MTFKASGALFQQPIEKIKARLKERFDPSKNYPQYDGVLNVPADQAYELAQYLMNGSPVGDRQEIPIQVSGWKRESANGVYLSLQLGPHYKYESNATQAAAAAPSRAVGDDEMPF
jgi:hypothetical protein